MTSEPLTQDLFGEPLTYSQRAIPANRSAQPGSDEARQITVTSGRMCAALLPIAGPLGSVVRTLLATSVWDSTRCLLIWKPKRTPAGRLLFQLAPSMASTSAIESGFLPTPTINGNYNRKGASETSGDGLDTAIRRLLATPHTSCHTGPGHQGRSGGMNLQTQMGGLLNPDFVEGMMGLPPGWTQLKSSDSWRDIVKRRRLLRAKMRKEQIASKHLATA